MRVHPLLWALVAAGLVAAFMLGRMTAPESGQVQPATRSLSAPAPDEGTIARELAELRRAVELSNARAMTLPGAEPRPLSGASSRSSDRPGETEASSEWLAALHRLEALVSSEHERTRASLGRDRSGSAALERVRDAEGPVDWAAWQPILDLWRVDPAGARKQLKLLSAEQLLERFGPPTDIWTVAQGITWQYARDFDPVTETWDLEIILRVPDGYVTQLAVRGERW